MSLKNQNKHQLLSKQTNKLTNKLVIGTHTHTQNQPPTKKFLKKAVDKSGR